MHRSNYSKIENVQRKISILALDKIAAYFDITLDELVYMGEDTKSKLFFLIDNVIQNFKTKQAFSSK